MTLDKLKEFLACLGVQNSTQSGKWVTARCPLAPFTHQKGKDSTPSFGVLLGEDRFHCFACERGTLAELLGTIDFHLSRRPELRAHFKLSRARELLYQEDTDLMALPEYEEFVPSTTQEFVPWPEWWLDQFCPWDLNVRSSTYLREERMLSAEGANKFELRYDEKRDFIVCPFRTMDGVLAGARGRRISTGLGLKHYDYPCNGVRNSGLIWYNEEALNLHGTLVLVEGQFDAMRLWPHHRKVMAVLSAATTAYKMKKLETEDRVLVMLDNPKVDATAGKKIGDWVKFFTSKGIECGVVEYPEGVKDAGEAPESFLRELAESL